MNPLLSSYQDSGLFSRVEKIHKISGQKSRLITGIVKFIVLDEEIIFPALGDALNKNYWILHPDKKCIASFV